MNKDKNPPATANKEYLKKTLQNSVELAFESLSNDIGDNLYDFELMQITAVNSKYSEEMMDQLANKIDYLFIAQMEHIISKLNEEIQHYVQTQEVTLNNINS